MTSCQSSVIVLDKESKKAIVIDITSSNIREKEHEKLEEYQGLSEELDNMWRVKDTVLPNWRTKHYEQFDQQQATQLWCVMG